MTATCTQCGIRYAADLPACPWCGHAGEATSEAPKDSTTEAPAAATPTHTEGRVVPPPPPRTSVSYDLADIPGPQEEWEPIDDWIEQEGGPAPRRIGSSRARRWTILGLGGVALIVLGAILAEVVPVGLNGSSSLTEAPSVAPTVATTVAPTTQPPPTTEPTATTEPPATTAPPTEGPSIEPIGAAVPISELRISELSFGDLEFGSDGVTAVGRLVATFGQPDVDIAQTAPIEEPGGFCVDAPQRMLQWGSLFVYNRVDPDGTQTLASVQVRLVGAPEPDPALAIETLSGLKVSDTMAQMRSIYEGFQIEEFPETGGGIWEVRSSSDGRLLLWGTNSGGEGDGDTITSMRSALRCLAD